MSVQFILGRSGTGKSNYCIKTIVDLLCQTDSEQPLLLLVPEQATYQAERAILADKRISGYSRLNVVSFARLQFLSLNKNTAKPVLSTIGQQMIISRILQEQKGKLKIFANSVHWGGLIKQMNQTITEMHRYAKNEEDIEQLIQDLTKNEKNKPAAMKFADIGLVFKEYLRFIENRFIDPDAQLNLARQAAGEADFIKGAMLWVDGFAGFTTSEQAFLTEMLKAAKETKIALCLDPVKSDFENPSAMSLFGPTEQTYADIVEIIMNCKLSLLKPIVLTQTPRFSENSIKHIEQNIFEPTAKKIAASDNIRIVAAANVRSEVEFVVQEILRLVRQKGLRYRDIAVITSNTDDYQHYVKAYFDDYGVPFFIDKRKPLNQHAVVRLLSSAFGVISGGFLSSEVLAYLKTGLVLPNSGDISLLENYCLAFGVQGKDWTNERKWNFQSKHDTYFDEQRVNEIRLKAAGALLELGKRLCPNGDIKRNISAEEFVEIIFDFLERLKIRDRIGEWVEEAEKNKEAAVAEEQQQFYIKLLDIFDELVEVFGGMEVGCDDFIAIVNSAFSQMTMAFIPPTLDQVLVGSIERSRHPDLKAVFLMGVTQKQFPVPIVNDGLLSEYDRQTAAEFDFCLGKTSSQSLAGRQYLAYIAFTRASEFFCVSYPMRDNSGAGVVRSQFVDDLEALFLDLREESISDEKTQINDIQSKGCLAELLCYKLGKDNKTPSTKSELSDLLDELCGDEELAELGAKIKSAIEYDNTAVLEKTAAKELFGKQIKSSASRLGVYAACPYKYFARYMLSLKERREFKFKPLDIGNFYHRILDRFLKNIISGKKDFDCISDDELLDILRLQISTLLEEDAFISNFIERRRHNAFIIHSGCDVLEEFVFGMAKMIRSGKFRPVDSEVCFGDKSWKDMEGAKPGEYKLSFGNGREVLLRGKIDRFDIASINGEKIGIVFDYKRKGKSFNWSYFYHGLDLQLAIYMLAGGNGQLKVDRMAGAFYVPVEVSPKKVTFDELEKSSDKFRYKAKGVFDGEFYQNLDSKVDVGWSEFYNFHVSKKDAQYGNYGKSGALKAKDFESMLKFAEEKIISLVEKMVSGCIEILPYKLKKESPCGNCEYKSVCRFDWEVDGYNYLETKDKKEFFEVIRANGS